MGTILRIITVEIVKALTVSRIADDLKIPLQEGTDLVARDVLERKLAHRVVAAR
jgi:hypothetical protein